jgi:hypothetical protein
MSVNVIQTPFACVTASDVRMTLYTIHGWRPTSVTIQPHSSATTDATPDMAVARRNQRDCGKSFLRHQPIPSQSARRMSALQIPTIASKDKCSSVFAGGRSSGGTESSPVTCVFVLHPTRNESSPGMPMPPLTPLDVHLPPRYSVTWVDVCCTHSIAANLIGWSLAMARAAESPTANWIGVAMHATVKGIRSPSRWMRSRRPRSIPVA